ncbi:MAG TPA: photosynthetic complex assembly protein PuhC [Rhodopila sp.]|nr:photosynthetic complex assembly protein PuhC [Rhodopila sp.]
MHAHHKEPFPRAVLFAAGGVIALSIATAAIGRLTGAGDTAPTSKAVISRNLLFRDRANGAVAVYDAAHPAAPIETIAPETNGFLRATMRGLAQQRLRQDASRAVPFRLTGWADGRLTLSDPTTGRSVDMEAFGHTNEAVFVHLLTAKAGS